MLVGPGFVEHGPEEVVACTQNPRVCGDSLSVCIVPHEEDDITSVLVLVQIVSSAEDKGGRLVSYWDGKADIVGSWLIEREKT